MDAIVKCVLDCLPGHAVSGAASLSAAVADDYDGEDRISALPDELLRDVISRLPVKDAFRTTALSTRWRRVWHSVPLVLRDADLPASPHYPEPVAAVASVLAGHPGPFCTVHLAHRFMLYPDLQLSEWPRLLAAKGVEDLVFVNRPLSLPRDVYRELPADILRCASLRRLYLGFWTFPDTAGLHRGADVFPRLRELGICHTGMEERDLEYMLACSPELEILALVASCYLSRVRIGSHTIRCVLLWSSMAEEVAVVDAPLLERLIMWQPFNPCEDDESDGESVVRIEIARAPELRVLGYLEPRVHELHIGNNVIKADTKASPSSVVPSVKILALKVNLGAFREVQMLVSFLGCFPNVETLHVESALASEPTGTDDLEFFGDLGPVECARSHIKKVVLHEFRGDPSEIAFLKYLSPTAEELQKLVLVMSHEKHSSADEMKVLLSALDSEERASGGCAMLLVGPEVLSFHRASDLSVDDPFR